MTGSLSGKTIVTDEESSSTVSVDQSLAQRLESLVAYSSYSVLSGEAKEQPGDGTFNIPF